MDQQAALTELQRRLSLAEAQNVALRESEERYRSLFESMDEACAVVEVIADAAGSWCDFRFVEVNSAFMQHSTMLHPVGRTATELLGTPNSRWVEIYGRVADTGEPARFEEPDLTLHLVFDYNIFRIGGPGSRRVAALFSDITSRKKAEEALRQAAARDALRVMLTDGLRGAAGPLDVQALAMRLLGDHLGASQITYGEAEPGSADYFINQREYRRDPSLPTALGRHRWDDTGRYVASELRDGRTLVVSDMAALAQHSTDDSAVYEAAGVRAIIAVPLVRNGRITAHLAVNHTSARAWSAEEVALVEEMAERIWAAVERARAEAALRESEARLVTAFGSLPVGIAVIDLAGAVVLSNAEYRRFVHNGIIPTHDTAQLGRWRGWDENGELLAPQDFPGARAIRGERVVPGCEMLYTADEGREIWTIVAAVPTFDAAGAPSGFVSVIRDINDNKRVAEMLLSSEERLRQFGEASQDILWMRDAETLQWTYLTQAFEKIYGLSREEALSGDNYHTSLDLMLPEYRRHAERCIERARCGEHVTFEYRIRRPGDGEVRWLRDTAFPIADTAGRLVKVGGIGQDFTDAKHRQDRLIGSEERLRSAAEIARLGLWDWNVRTGDIHWSDEHFRMEGYTVGEIIPSFEAWAARVHPADLDEAVAALDQARDTREEFNHEFRTVHPDGSVHWLHGRGRFFYNETGEPVRMVGAMTDTTERREWDERQSVLVAELQHRTRNLIAVVRSMADKTMRRARDLTEFRDNFRDRLEALARAQSLLSRLEEHDRVTFDEFIRTELIALGMLDDNAERVSVNGPVGVRLRSSTVQTLAMALHELATNAAKYGALAQPTGHLSVSWQLEPRDDDDQPWLHIDWREAGVMMPEVGAPPAGTGQGRELIERALPYQLKATTTYELGQDGVHCTIRIPVSGSIKDRKHADN